MAAADACGRVRDWDSAPSTSVPKARDRKPDREGEPRGYIADRQRTRGLSLRHLSDKRRWFLPTAVLTILLAAAGPGLGQGIELSPSTSCVQIVNAIRRLAAAEHRQAQALELMARGGNPALVESKFQILLERKHDLSFTLKRISMDPVASDAGVNRCLSNGYQALYQSERLSASIERILVRGRLRSQNGDPLSELSQPPAAMP